MERCRVCKIEGKKAYFHRWVDHKQVLESAIMKSGHSGRQIAFTMGLVEYENGKVDQVYPNKIKFIDTAVFHTHEIILKGDGNDN